MELFEVTKEEVVRDIMKAIKKVEQYNKCIVPFSENDYWCCNAYHYLHEALPEHKVRKRAKRSKGIR